MAARAGPGLERSRGDLIAALTCAVWVLGRFTAVWRCLPGSFCELQKLPGTQVPQSISFSPSEHGPEFLCNEEPGGTQSSDEAQGTWVANDKNDAVLGNWTHQEPFPASLARCLPLPGLSPAAQTEKQLKLSDFFFLILLAQIWIYSSPPSPLSLFLITLVYNPDLTLARQRTGFLHIHMAVGDWSHVAGLCGSFCAVRTSSRHKNHSEWSSFASAEHGMRFKCLCLMTGSPRHRAGRCGLCLSQRNRGDPTETLGVEWIGMNSTRGHRRRAAVTAVGHT